ncbi:MAG TPA: glycoside hydrolase family 9 protein [Planctomycetota bacterium]
MMLLLPLLALSSVEGQVVDIRAMEVSRFIVVDQFGYLPDARKVAVVRDPQTGYDADQSFTPGASLALVDLKSGETALTAAAVPWNAGATDPSSGDRAWWFDFSNVTRPGTYAVVDRENKVRSPSFRIAADVYKPVLKHAFRTFYYQRAGCAKKEPFAEAAWADGASHVGPQQDGAARLHSDKANPATAKDLSGGWYDAGDYNKYTSWTADYVLTLLHAYVENPAAWGDDFNLPESGNGRSDLLDEVKWGVDWLARMQDAAGNGAVLSIVGLHHASPPSAATGPSYYGPASTNATLSTAAAFAFAGKVLKDPGLISRAEKAWAWAVANPSVIFKNNDAASKSSGLGSGQQETNDAGRALKKRMASVYLFAATGGDVYKAHVEAEYTKAALKTYADAFREMENTSLLYYANLPGASPAVAATIKGWFRNAMNSGENWTAMKDRRDPYLAYLNPYVWGSNRDKAAKGGMFMDLLKFDVPGFDPIAARNSGLAYLNYIHGVNPLSLVYLSNMSREGAHASVNEFYHTWFCDGSARWDRVGVSTHGPAPGFLAGGANPTYDWDGVCNSPNPHPKCGQAAPNPPKGQPAQKAFKEFNTAWPLNSWSVTENSNSYQTHYLRLLSKFVN